MTFHPFQKFLELAARRRGIATEVKAASVCHYFRTIIPQVFNNRPEAEKNISPAYFRETYLVINTTSPAWAQEVIMRKQEIIRAVNERAGTEVIKNLRTQLKNFQS